MLFYDWSHWVTEATLASRYLLSFTAVRGTFSVGNSIYGTYYSNLFFVRNCTKSSRYCSISGISILIISISGISLPMNPAKSRFFIDRIIWAIAILAALYRTIFLLTLSYLVISFASLKEDFILMFSRSLASLRKSNSRCSSLVESYWVYSPKELLCASSVSSKMDSSLKPKRLIWVVVVSLLCGERERQSNLILDSIWDMGDASYSLTPVSFLKPSRKVVESLWIPMSSCNSFSPFMLFDYTFFFPFFIESYSSYDSCYFLTNLFYL